VASVHAEERNAFMNRDMAYETPHLHCAGCRIIFKCEEIIEGYCGCCRRKMYKESIIVMLLLIILTIAVVLAVGTDDLKKSPKSQPEIPVHNGYNDYNAFVETNHIGK
jgi:hypothetical protein